jgi:hypothetical protein
MNVALGAGSGRSPRGRDVGSLELAAVNLNLEESSRRSQHGGGQVALWVCIIDCAVMTVGMGTCRQNQQEENKKKLRAWIWAIAAAQPPTLRQHL